MANYDTHLSAWYNNYIPGRFPIIRKPHIIGYFSLNGEREYIPSAENLKYLKLPKDINNVNFDLNHGYENVIPKPASTSDEGLKHLLEFIIQNKQKLITRNDGPDKRYLEADFICYRGLLRLVMCSPFERRDDWCILATRYKGNIYLCQRETEMKKMQKLNETEQWKRIGSYGFKFEQYILADDPEDEPDILAPVNESEEFNCVLRTRLEGLDLLYGAEMDGIVSNEKCDLTSVDLNTLEHVEVKVRRKETTYRQGQNFLKFNLVKWWCQSFLVGIQRIYMGLRNDEGIVKEIQVLDVSSLPKMAKEYWSPAVCVDFLNEFLNMVKKTLRNTNCPYSVFEFYWNPANQKSITYRYHEGNNDLSFLPDWYIEGVSNKSTNSV